MLLKIARTPRTELYKSVITKRCDHTFVYFLLGIHATYSMTQCVNVNILFMSKKSNICLSFLLLNNVLSHLLLILKLDIKTYVLFTFIFMNNILKIEIGIHNLLIIIFL